MNEFETDDESSVWSWVTGIVLLAMVIWVAAELSAGDASRADPDAGVVITAQVQPRPGPAAGIDTLISPAAFSAWVRDSSSAPEWSGDDAFVQASLVRLSAALADLARRTESAELQQRVAALQHSLAGSGRESTAAVAAARAAMLEAGAIARELHEQSGADEHRNEGVNDIAAALAAVHELDPAEPLQRQRHVVERYLTAMAQALMAIMPAT